MTGAVLEIVLGPFDAIPPGEGRAYEAAGVRVAVFHTRDGRVFAVQADCPHRGGPLADGLTGGGTLICPLHSWKFDLETGAALSGECGLKTYQARVNGAGSIVLALS